MPKRPITTCHCGSHAWVGLTKGYVALISPQDAIKIQGRNWKAKIRSDGKQVYAYGQGGLPMHRVIGGVDSPEFDHINHIGVDNQRGNLRPATGTQNQYNVRKRKVATSRFKGVSWASSRGLWVSKIYVRGRSRHLGYFASEDAAHAAYEKARLEIVQFEPALAAA